MIIALIYYTLIKCILLSRQVHQQVAQGSATCLEVLTLRQGKVINRR